MTKNWNYTVSQKTSHLYYGLL